MLSELDGEQAHSCFSGLLVTEAPVAHEPGVCFYLTERTGQTFLVCQECSRAHRPAPSWQLFSGLKTPQDAQGPCPGSDIHDSFIAVSELAYCCLPCRGNMRWPCPQNHLGIVKQRLVSRKVGGDEGPSVVLGAHSESSHLGQKGERSRLVSWIRF